MNGIEKPTTLLKPSLRLSLKFTALTGLRKQEALDAHNLIVRLVKSDDLESYFNEELNVLEHFKFKDTFLRRTKNAYISFIPDELVAKMIENKEVTYKAVLWNLARKNLRCRINELRDYFATFMVRHGLIREEVDLLQGRIPPNIFIRHYWSPSFKELRNRTLKALESLEQTLQHSQ